VAEASIAANRVLGNAISFEREGVPWSYVQDPRSSARLVAGLTGPGPDYPAFLAAFDPAAIRYVPGAAVIGRGAVSRMIVDPKGRIFGLLPWSGTLVRIGFK
jgi:hypothetical protein